MAAILSNFFAISQLSDRAAVYQRFGGARGRGRKVKV